MSKCKGEFRVVADSLDIPCFGGPRVRVVFLTDEGQCLGVCPWGDTLEECRADYEAMGEAFNKPVIDRGGRTGP